MNGTVVITLENGMVLSGSVTSTALKTSDHIASKAPLSLAKATSEAAVSDGKLDFSLPVRPFMNDYSDGLSGSKKYALLVAHFAKGEIDVVVDRGEVIDAWNKMTGLLGGKFNGAHESRAKDAGWVYVPEPGKIALLKKWPQVLS